MGARSPSGPKKRREHGDDGIYWDKINKCYVGTISLGNHSNGKRRRRTVRGKTKTEVKDKLSALHDEINAGIQTPAAYTVRQCVTDWLDSLELDPHTVATYRGQAEKWIYPAIGATKLKDFKATDADRFFRDAAKVLSKASLVKIKSTLTRSIRRAQKYDLIGRNVAELVDLPQGQPGHPSRAMSEEQAGKVLKAASGQADGLRQGGQGEPGPVRGDPRGHGGGRAGLRDAAARKAPVTEVGTDLGAVTCRICRAELGTDDRVSEGRRLEALFVLSITLGLRPGELRKLSWDHVDLDKGVIHVWRSASRTGDVKTPKSRRSLVLPRRAMAALMAHRKLQAAERLAAGAAWHDNNLVFCHEDGRMYSKRRAQLAVQQDDAAGRDRSLARPRRTAHRRVDHEQQRRAAAGHQRHRGPQVHPRHRDRVPARDRARHPRRGERDGHRLRRRRQNTKTAQRTWPLRRSRTWLVT